MKFTKKDDKVLIEVNNMELCLLEEGLLYACGIINKRWNDRGVKYDDITDEWDVKRNVMHDEIWKIVSDGI